MKDVWLSGSRTTVLDVLAARLASDPDGPYGVTAGTWDSVAAGVAYERR